MEPETVLEAGKRPATPDGESSERGCALRRAGYASTFVPNSCGQRGGQDRAHEREGQGGRLELARSREGALRGRKRRQLAPGRASLFGCLGKWHGGERWDGGMGRVGGQLAPTCC
ncbi:hypothetical protein BU26DRAFT_84817 [Trematosphaeria pertusa]|uniref:Uncharacterized protein n=1 Tax=Trematosphaeria pertusa TaxID=390896 RepID=A0A6A6I3Z8_9PLEO|nr:uncharacterized protein BU26DRAFT_84817 [Trematosphaeria pertusa]KAF2244728.1 hypothetical protein BU26DRAFT_84817 [Trematosphaeria pertusa]